MHKKERRWLLREIRWMERQPKTGDWLIFFAVLLLTGVIIVPLIEYHWRRPLIGLGVFLVSGFFALKYLHRNKPLLNKTDSKTFEPKVTQALNLLFEKK